MENLEKKQARQFRYKEKKKAQGFQYVQIWIPVKKSNLDKFKIALTHSSFSDIEKFIDSYFKKPQTYTTLFQESLTIKSRKQFSNDPFLIRKIICLLLCEDPQISGRKMSQILFNQYKLCTFNRKTNKPSLINSGTISKTIYQCRQLINL